MSSLFFILARHAESGHNYHNRIQGHLDSKLTVLGARQAGLLAKALVKFKVRRIYSSDLGRAMATTRIVARQLKKRITRVHQLREIYLGTWEGLTPVEVNTKYSNGFVRWRRSPSRMVIPGAEPVRKFRKRVHTAVHRIIKEGNPAGPVLIVTHGGVIASCISDWLGADFDRVLLDLRFDNTGLTLVEYKNKKFIIHAINDIAHLGRSRPRAKIFTQCR